MISFALFVPICTKGYCEVPSAVPGKVELESNGLNVLTPLSPKTLIANFFVAEDIVTLIASFVKGRLE
jgi:hypothetical protein